MIYASQARFLSLLTDFYSAQKSVEANGCHGNMRGKNQHSIQDCCKMLFALFSGSKGAAACYAVK